MVNPGTPAGNPGAPQNATGRFTASHGSDVGDDSALPLVNALPEFRVYGNVDEDDASEHDLNPPWSAGYRRVITGTDILGRLLRDIAAREEPALAPA